MEFDIRIKANQVAVLKQIPLYLPVVIFFLFLCLLKFFHQVTFAVAM